MRYVMKQKWLSLAAAFTIKDQNERDCFAVQGKVFSIGDKLTIADMNGQEQAFIKQKVLSWTPTYEIYRGGQVVAVVRKKMFTFFNVRFTVEAPAMGNMEAAGDFFSHEYSIVRNGQAAAAVSKQWFAWTDTYGVDIAPGQDDVLMLAIAVVIDMVCHGKSKGGVSVGSGTD